MTILITGATGLIGTHLAATCIEIGHVVHYLTTSKEKIDHKPNYKGFYWNPASGEIDKDAFNGVDSIVHLAGASIAKRWTKSYRKTIIDSRVKSAELLFNALESEKHNVKQFISASGIGIYPASLTKLYSEEDTEVDDSFLGQVVVAWELAADRFKTLGIDVAKVRTGLVLAKHQGALPQLVRPIRLGLGAPLGSGKQWQSWIHIDDVARIYVAIIENEWEGIFNAVAPTPVTNKKLTHQVANILEVPCWLPNVPGFLLKLVLGRMSMLLLEGQLVSSKKLDALGFSFKYHNLEIALEDLL
jgi:uncharacterized protein (TIGR01777 family)